jgi:hypothetical protein
MADYGVDVKALSDLPDPEEIATGDENVAHALGRLLLQPDTALDEIGDNEDCDSVDLRDYLGESMSAEDVRQLEARIVKILSRDPRVETVEVSVTLTAGELSVEVDGNGTEGPFSLVLTVDEVSASILAGG